MSDVLVCVRDLIKTYASGTETLHILQGAEFEIKRGSSVSVTGESGSGKSTLLNILGGLDRADSGSVMVGGAEIAGLSESALSVYRSRRVGFIFQFHYLLKDFTALENVMLPAYIAGVKKKDALEHARLLLQDVHLEDRLHHYPSQLSGGERQRVAVARSLVNDPDLILADEPTGNLDSQNSALVAELLYAGAEKWGKTLMVVTHDKGVAERAEARYTLAGGILRTVEGLEPVKLATGGAQTGGLEPEGSQAGAWEPGGWEPGGSQTGGREPGGSL
ncbi:lipoprotein-releasing system ATP-binding protein LolD [Spirochaetia bacterium]|nr:lipoprotein-releasing system ATP-binding protein LolD [Spirochaetia bacterium]